MRSVVIEARCRFVKLYKFFFFAGGSKFFRWMLRGDCAGIYERVAGVRCAENFSMSYEGRSGVYRNSLHFGVSWSNDGESANE